MSLSQTAINLCLPPTKKAAHTSTVVDDATRWNIEKAIMSGAKKSGQSVEGVEEAKTASKRKVRFSIPDSEGEAVIIMLDSKKRTTKSVAPEDEEADTAGASLVRAWAKSYCKNVIGGDTRYPWDGDSNLSDLSDSDSDTKDALDSDSEAVKLDDAADAQVKNDAGEAELSEASMNVETAVKVRSPEAKGDKLEAHHMSEGARPVAKRAAVAENPRTTVRMTEQALHRPRETPRSRGSLEGSE